MDTAARSDDAAWRSLNGPWDIELLHFNDLAVLAPSHYGLPPFPEVGAAFGFSIVLPR